MYVPSHFLPDQEDLAAFISKFSFGELISNVEGRIFSTHLPFLLDEENNRLQCHVAKANPQWRQIAEQEVLAMFHGPHGYISPSWYETAGVPTWNYQAVHVYAQANCYDDQARLKTLVEKLSAVHEASFENPWRPEFNERMLKSIVGIDLDISEVQVKHKLSQNRTEAEQRNVINRLHQQGNAELAEVMSKVLPPSD